MNGEIAILGIVRARQEGEELKSVEPLLGGGQVGPKGFEGGGVVLFGRQVGHHLGVIEALGDGVGRVDRRLQALEGLDRLLGGLLVVPETGGGHLLFDCGEVPSLAGDVKESPGAP